MSAAVQRYLPLALPVLLALAALPLVGSGSAWVTLTAAGLAMGMMVFIMASGLTLVFGLMDVLNFGHGAFISVGAYVATLVLLPLAGWMQTDSLAWNLAALAPAILVAMAATGALGLVFERVIVMPVYGQHLKQILVTMGGLIIAEQLLHALWGPNQIPLPLPTALRGSIALGDAAVEKYRLVAVVVGLVVFVAMMLVLGRTKLGLLIRAGVENGEMVEALGYRIRRLFVGVFVVGSALAGLGGVMWALYRESVTAGMGLEVMILVFIVVIVGGLGSVGGCFLGSLLVALLANYTGFLAPKLALGSNILLMVAILMWRPQGLYPLGEGVVIAPLSHDPPRSRLLAVALIVILLGLALAPFLFPGTRPLNVAAKICVFVLLVAAYDLLLGYAGIVSFAHTMFYGIGAYGVGLTLYGLGPTWLSVGLGFAAALALAVVLAVAIGLFSLRVQAIFFAMITLAIASAFAILASQLSGLTGGEDGRTFGVPELLRPGTRLVEGELFGVALTGRVISYYLVFFGCLAGFLVLLRIVNAPFGRVLQAIRENGFRAEALGYRTVVYRTLANAIAAAMAAFAGALMALWLRYTGPDTTLSLSIMIDILLMVVIGGMGTMYGAVLGAALFVLAQNYLQALMGLAAEATAGVPVLPQLLHPDRWLLWLGVLFVLSVYFFPTGIVGRLRARVRD